MNNHEEPQYDQEQQGPPPQPDGFFARVNGGMIQSGKFADSIVSLVGQIVSHDTIRTADGSNVRVNTEHLTVPDGDETDGAGAGLIVDPNVCVEIMGQVHGPTEIMVRKKRIQFI